MSETNPHQELPGKDDYIIPSEYYDRYRLIFSHFHLDRKLVRIGKNGYQRKAETKVPLDAPDRLSFGWLQTLGYSPPAPYDDFYDLVICKNRQ